MLKTSINKMAKNKKRISHSDRRLRMIGKLALEYAVSKKGRNQQQAWTYIAVLNNLFRLFVRCTSLKAMLTRKSFWSCCMAKPLVPKRTTSVVTKLPPATTISKRFHPFDRKLLQPSPKRRTRVSMI
jgi:hypothetical protein